MHAHRGGRCACALPTSPLTEPSCVAIHVTAPAANQARQPSGTTALDSGLQGGAKGGGRAHTGA
jgi:hypothetical protein